MPDWSRRHALRAVITAGAFALAGCSGESSSSTSVPPDRGEPVSDVDVVFVRETDGNPLFETGDEMSGSTGEVEYLTSADERDGVTFRSSPPATELRTFVDATDLKSESVYLLERAIGECYEVRLVSVYRESNGVDAAFCQALRPADVECSADAEDTIGVAIRLPFAGDSFNTLGTRWSSDCDRHQVLAREDGGSA